MSECFLESSEDPFATQPWSQACLVPVLRMQEALDTARGLRDTGLLWHLSMDAASGVKSLTPLTHYYTTRVYIDIFLSVFSFFLLTCLPTQTVWEL